MKNQEKQWKAEKNNETQWKTVKNRSISTLTANQDPLMNHPFNHELSGLIRISRPFQDPNFVNLGCRTLFLWGAKVYSSYVGDMSLLQLWQGLTLLWSVMGVTIRECSVNGFLIFSGEETSLWDFPLWIFKPFSVLKSKSHWSHWKPLPCFFEFWLDSKPVAEDSKVGFFKRNSFLRFAFHLSVEGLTLYLEGGVSFPLSDPESND